MTRRAENRQPVTVIEQKGQQHEDAEVHLQHAVALLDMQRGQHHEGHAHQAAVGAAAADQPVQQAQARGRAAADHQRGGPGVVPEGQAEGIQGDEPEHPEHQAVGLQMELTEHEKPPWQAREWAICSYWRLKSSTLVQ